uniref:Treslin N-terminal domain-containing protein n=1 Tax=Ciona savignyi TaxID=51511 RepID=H2ZFE5_CIOSA
MPAGNQIVFLIHRTTAKRQESDHEVWKKDLHNAACKLLLHFESLDYKALNWNIKVGSVENENDQFKWGYKFAKKAGIQFHNLCDFKKLNSENVKLFEQELNYDDEEEQIEYSAHTLVENLITLAHDFHWEHLEIMSPVKPLRKRKSRDMESRKRRSNGKTNIAEITASGNYVFIVGPVPKSKDELGDYFGWEVDTLAEVTRILMPAHLSHHFREKHNIRLYWLDTNSKTPELFEKKGPAGFSVIEEFLKS